MSQALTASPFNHPLEAIDLLLPIAFSDGPVVVPFSSPSTSIALRMLSKLNFWRRDWSIGLRDRSIGLVPLGVRKEAESSCSKAAEEAETDVPVVLAEVGSVIVMVVGVLVDEFVVSSLEIGLLLSSSVGLAETKCVWFNEGSGRRGLVVLVAAWWKDGMVGTG